MAIAVIMIKPVILVPPLNKLELVEESDDCFGLDVPRTLSRLMKTLVALALANIGHSSVADSLRDDVKIPFATASDIFADRELYAITAEA